MAKAFALLLAVLWLANEAAVRVFHSPFPPPNEVRLTHADAVQNVSLMALGMRRLAADLSFIQLLMYYGGDDEPAPGEQPHHPHLPGEEHGHDHGPEFGKGRYRQLAPKTERILDLDPFFSYGTLYTAGALAFNLDRPEDALRVLRHASARDPKQWKYRAYAAAIGFHKKGDPEQVLAELSPVLREPDCPTMLKNTMAFLNRRLGRREEAIRLYREILLSRDKDYQAMSRRALEELGALID